MKKYLKTSLLCVGAFGLGFGALWVWGGDDSRGKAQAAAGTSSTANSPSTTPKEIDWALLRELDYKSGKTTDNLKKMEGNLVRIPGFIIPLEDNQNVVTEFLFVPTPGACIHVPPPPPNQTIYVKMAPGKNVKMTWAPVWLQGRLHISEVSTALAKSSYSIVGDTTENYQ